MGIIMGLAFFVVVGIITAGVVISNKKQEEAYENQRNMIINYVNLKLKAQSDIGV